MKEKETSTSRDYFEILKRLLEKGFFTETKETPPTKAPEKELQQHTTTNIVVNIYYNPERKGFFVKLFDRFFRNKTNN